MSEKRKSPQASSSDAILNSLFDDIARGKVNYVAEDLLTKATTPPPPPSSKIVKIAQPISRPSTSSAKDSIKNSSLKIRPPNRDKKKSEAEIDDSEAPPIKREKKNSRAIKIGSLKETTKSKILDASTSSAEQLQKQQQQHPSKSNEDGEILPSDIGSDDTKSDVDEFDVIDETDGELKASDTESKSKKKKSKKKKREHRKHRHEHRDQQRRKMSEKDDRRKSDSSSTSKLKTIDDTSSRFRKENSRERDQERRPWRKMLNFHLNLDQRREYENRSRRDFVSNSNAIPIGRDRMHSKYESHSSTSYRNGRSSSPSNSNWDGRNNGSRRGQAPSSNSFYARGGERDRYSRTASFQAQDRSESWNSNENRDFRQRRNSRKRSRSRSLHRSPTNKERVSLPRSRTLEKKIEQKSKSPSKEQKPDDERIDKQKLYEIARRNAAAMLRAGGLQTQLANMTTEDLMKLRSGGKSVEELIAYCKKIQKREDKREAGESSSDEGEPTKKGEGEDELDAFIRHPFLLKPQAFVFNVKNVTQIPIKTPAERAADESKLRITFPVSSGEQHRTSEPDWVPVVPAEKSEKTKDQTTKAPKSTATETRGGGTMLALPPPPALPAVLPFIPPPPPPPLIQQPMEQPPVDIGEVISTRLKAIKRLNDNANDVEAMKLFHFAEEQMKRWTESKNIPGLFMGGTGASCLTPDQLAPSDIRCHAWAKKDTFTSAKPVSSGVGMQLMQKMGWRPGEGLGKNNEGALEPLMLEVKSDRKGLLASEEGATQRIRATNVNMKDFQGKHPVSALMELCSKRRWGAPEFACVEAGPPHDRRFTWKTVVNGVEYQAATPTNNKKTGKAQVCQVVLQSLGMVPRDKTLPVVVG